MLPENILFSSDPGNDLKRFLDSKKYSRIAVLTDENTSKHCIPIIKHQLGASEIIEVRSGEEQKTLQTCSLIWEEMTEMMLDRYAVLIVVGGGVLGDMGGFCAATYKRGIDFILLPTTLLSQVDASVGGKLGVDFNTFKNHIGVFQQPALTLIHPGFLGTLPFNELRSGFAEVIKHCLISDGKMFDEIASRNLLDQPWEKLIKHSVEFKALVTQKDPREKGLRKILNAGHTIGHAVESYLLGSGKKILHGDAIAIGLIAEGYLAVKRGMLQQKELTRIAGYLTALFGKVPLSDADIIGSTQLVLQDKKNRDNQVLCVLLKGIGGCEWDQAISTDEVKEGLSFYQRL
jgi:3-dehydroquinate synthase